MREKKFKKREPLIETREEALIGTGEIIEKLDEILGGNSEKIVELADRFGKHLVGKKLSGSQIRKIYGEVRRMKMRGFDRDKLTLLRPLLAYATRHKEAGIKDLQVVLDAAIKKVDDERKFENFVNFFEAILAYHRAYGGKE